MCELKNKMHANENTTTKNSQPLIDTTGMAHCGLPPFLTGARDLRRCSFLSHSTIAARLATSVYLSLRVLGLSLSLCAP